MSKAGCSPWSVADCLAGAGVRTGQLGIWLSFRGRELEPRADPACRRQSRSPAPRPASIMRSPRSSRSSGRTARPSCTARVSLDSIGRVVGVVSLRPHAVSNAPTIPKTRRAPANQPRPWPGASSTASSRSAPLLRAVQLTGQTRSTPGRSRYRSAAGSNSASPSHTGQSEGWSIRDIRL